MRDKEIDREVKESGQKFLQGEKHLAEGKKSELIGFLLNNAGAPGPSLLYSIHSIRHLCQAYGNLKEAYDSLMRIRKLLEDGLKKEVIQDGFSPEFKGHYRTHPILPEGSSKMPFIFGLKPGVRGGLEGAILDNIGVAFLVNGEVEQDSLEFKGFYIPDDTNSEEEFITFEAEIEQGIYRGMWVIGENGRGGRFQMERTKQTRYETPFKITYDLNI